MTTEDETIPPPLEGEAAEFLMRHAQTGTPTDAELARVGFSVPRVTALPVKPRKPIFPAEVWAAAAVIALAVAAQLTWLAFKKPSAEPGSIGAVTAAYRSGDLKGAAHLASSSCTDAACASMSAKLLRAMRLTAKFKELTARELEELRLLDVELSGGEETELTHAIAQAQAAPPVDAEQLLALAQALTTKGENEEALKLATRCTTLAKRDERCVVLQKALRASLASSVEKLILEMKAERSAKNYERSVMLGERCIEIDPLAHTCYRMLGSSYASIATRDQSAADMERAKKMYERFLEVAPADDEYIAKVKAILDAVDDRDQNHDRVKIAEGLAVSSRPRALQELTRILLESGPDEPEHQRALDAIARLGGAIPDENEVQALRLIGAAHVIEDNDPIEAEKFLRDAISRTTRPDTRARAERMLEELARPSPERALRLLYLQAYALKDTEPQRALEMFKQVLAQSTPDNEYHQKALSRIARLEDERDEERLSRGNELKVQDARELYLRGYQLKEADPQAAIELFEAIVARTPATDETHLKAVVRLAELKRASPPLDTVRTLTLSPGETQIVSVPGLARIAVGDPSIIETSLPGGERIKLVAQSAGETTVLVWTKSGTERISYRVRVK